MGRSLGVCVVNKSHKAYEKCICMSRLCGRVQMTGNANDYLVLPTFSKSSVVVFVFLHLIFCQSCDYVNLASNNIFVLIAAK